MECEQAGNFDEAQVVADTDAEDAKPGLGDGEPQVSWREHIFLISKEVGLAVVQDNSLSADSDGGVVQPSCLALAEASDDISIGGGRHLAPGLRCRAVQWFAEALKNRFFGGVPGDG